MDIAQALRLTRSLLEGLCEVRLDGLAFTADDEDFYLQLCACERDLLQCVRTGHGAPVAVMSRVEHVLSLA